MKYRLVRQLSFVLAIVVISAHGMIAARAADTPKIDATPFLGDHYPARKTAYPSGVVGLADVTYQTLVGYRPLNLDLYYRATVSSRPAKSVPLVIYIHGGGWANGHSRQSGAFDDWPGVLASISAQGYVVASLNYRLSSEAPFPAALQDVKSAIRWLRLHATDYGIDKEKVVVWGGSAGGQLAALTATTCGVKELEPARLELSPANSAELEQQSDCVQAAITWYGVFDFAAVPGVTAVLPVSSGAAGPALRYLDCHAPPCSAEAIRLASPVHFVNHNTPPFLLVHGADDKLVDPTQSRQFHAALQKAGVRTELLIIPGVDHSFIGSTPEATRDASLAALKRTLTFIESVVGH
jgi:acetyl esterase/lipase